jgi:putative membrane-bound dehydrogenase-like protein
MKTTIRFAVRLPSLLFFVASLVVLSTTGAHARDLNVLFLGDNGHHRPRERFVQLQPVLGKRGIKLVYTDQVSDLNPENLKGYDAVALYANIGSIDPKPEKALLDFVAGGGGFVPLHCATYCFRNSDKVVALMGGQFKRHGTGTFRTKIVQADHPIMKGFGGFESWDETYVHHKHNEKDRTVLTYRVDSEGREPWTWVRTHGKGRVFYTAWGHDQRTWGNAGFQNLVERGIRWAAGDDPSTVPNFAAALPFPVPQMTAKRKDVKPFEFIDVGAKIPNYTPSKKWGVQGEAKSQMQKPIEAKESIKHLVVPEGFRVELFASEPDIAGKPICMAWDERGRLWVAETYDYPNELQPQGKGRDRIRILEDTDGDFRADKFTVFAEKLSIPTSITFHRGGVIVQDGTQTLYLKDTNGDDVADEKTVLFTGWNQGDTHGGVSNFQYGHDNWIWAMQGYNGSSPTVKGEPQQRFGQGFFRFRADGSELEFIRSTNNNTWGLGISEEGIIFGSTANRNPSVYMPIPNRYYERVRGWTPSLRLGSIADTHLFKPITDAVRQVDQHGGYTAAAGHALYTARTYPQAYWNRTAFVNGPTGHLVGTFVLKPSGSDFQSTNPFNLLASDDEWTAPIMSEIGPDGNVWVIDWYNYIIQHNPVPHGFTRGKGNAYETDLRDKKHGRIYRIVYSGAKSPAAQKINLAEATPDGLVAALKHPTMLWRRHAQRLLVERGKLDVLPALTKLASDRSMDKIGLNVGVIHSLWTMHGLGALDGSHAEATAVAVAALRHPSAGVRRNAVQVLPEKTASTAALLASGVLADADAQVRLAAFLALSDLPTVPSAGAAILTAIEQPENTQDRWIPEAGISAAAMHSSGFLSALAQSTAVPSGKVLESAGIVAEHYARGEPVDSVAALVASLTQAKSPIADAIIGGLARGWPADATRKVGGQFEADLEKVLARLSPGSQGLLVKLARSWGSKRFEKYAREVSAALLRELDNDKLPLAKRLTAAQDLIEFQRLDKKVVGLLLERISPRTFPDLALGIIEALRKSESPEVGVLLIQHIGSLTPRTRSAGIAVLLSRPQSTTSLLDAVDRGVVQLAELSLDQKQALAAYPDGAIRNRARQLLSRGGALPNPDRQKVLAQLLPITRETGDPAAGKAVFKKQCAKCHMHSGEGHQIGPDLTGMAVHPKAELLLHIIDPSRNVEGNFRVYTVVTVDGKVLSGLLASESKTAIEIFDSEGKKKVILREDIDELVASPKSLMPEGFEKQVKRQEISDLLEFLTQRGKFLPIDLTKSVTITSARGMFINKQADIERFIFPDWSPKTFKGVPFHLIDPQDGRVANVILLHGPNGSVCAKMPKSVRLPCNGPAKAIHLLSGVSGWGYPYSKEKSVSMIVRLHYTDDKTEDHALLNGVHFADYIRKVDVPKSELAFMLRNQQMRYLAIYPKRPVAIQHIDLVKGPDRTAPVVMAVTLETP